MSFVRNKLGLYRDAISAAYEAISIIRLFPADLSFKAFYWWGADLQPNDAIGDCSMLLCVLLWPCLKRAAEYKRELSVHDVVMIAELNLCSGLCMLGRWSHAHAAIKRCAWIKRSDHVRLQHLKRVLNKYQMILQRTISILKLSPLVETSVQGTSVWPLLIRSNSSPKFLSPELRSMTHMPRHSFDSSESPIFDAIDSFSLDQVPAGTPSPHLAGKMRPGSASLLRPLSAMSQASNVTSDTNVTTITHALSHTPHAPYSSAAGYVFSLQQARVSNDAEGSPRSHDEP